MEKIDKETKGYYAEFEKEVRKLRRKSGGSGTEKKLATLLSAVVKTMVYSKADDEDESFATRLMLVWDAANTTKKPLLQRFAQLFMYLRNSEVLRGDTRKPVGHAVESSNKSTSTSTPTTSLLSTPHPSSKGRKSGHSVTPVTGGRKNTQEKVVERQTTDGETEEAQPQLLQLTPSGRPLRRVAVSAIEADFHAAEPTEPRSEENGVNEGNKENEEREENELPKRRAKEAANAKITNSRPEKRRSSGVHESVEKNGENEENEVNEEREETKRRRMEQNLLSPRTKKAKESLEKRVEVGFKPPSYRVKGAGELWPCAGWKCRDSLSSHAEVYQHMLNEHYLEGPLLGKCCSCKKVVAPFAEVIVHRKNGDEFTCGNENAAMEYWVELERTRRRDETEEEKEKREKLSVLAGALRKCMYKNCEGPSEKTYEGLEEHNRQVHQITVQYVCKREGCDRTFLHPLAFIRHMKDTCITGYPKVEVKTVKHVEKRKGGESH